MMRHSLVHLVVVVVVVAMASIGGCVFDLPQLGGLLCNDEHVCRTGDTCIGDPGVCVAAAQCVNKATCPAA